MLKLAVILADNEKVPYMGDGDTTYHLGLVRWGLERLVEGCAVLKCSDPGHESWAATLAQLADFHVDAKTGGLQVAKNLSFSVSHRHFSHLFPCFPLGLINATDPRCTAGADNWYTAAMKGPWCAAPAVIMVVSMRHLACGCSTCPPVPLPTHLQTIVVVCKIDEEGIRFC